MNHRASFDKDYREKHLGPSLRKLKGGLSKNFAGKSKSFHSLAELEDSHVDVAVLLPKGLNFGRRGIQKAASPSDSSKTSTKTTSQDKLHCAVTASGGQDEVDSLTEFLSRGINNNAHASTTVAAGGVGVLFGTHVKNSLGKGNSNSASNLSMHHTAHAGPSATTQYRGSGALLGGAVGRPSHRTGRLSLPHGSRSHAHAANHAAQAPAGPMSSSPQLNLTSNLLSSFEELDAAPLSPSLPVSHRSSTHTSGYLNAHVNASVAYSPHGLSPLGRSPPLSFAPSVPLVPSSLPSLHLKAASPLPQTSEDDAGDAVESTSPSTITPKENLRSFLAAHPDTRTHTVVESESDRTC